jgi:GNAT superfamily N-acetyltransferase
MSTARPGIHTRRTIVAIRIDGVPFWAVKPFAARAAKDHVSITDTKFTEWFVVRLDGVIVGIAAMMLVASGYRLKGAWVDPEHRGKGIGLALTEFRIRAIESRCASHIETLSLHPEFFEARGFRRERVMSNGAIRMRRIL